jgi:hypothetical protein
MRHLIFLFLIALCTLLGASCKNSKSERISQENKIYQNEFFSLEYPYNWEYDEEINDMYDTIPAMSKGIRVTLFNINPNTPWHTVMVQKSAMFECFKTPEEWRDASVQFKQFDDQYIGTVDSYMLDSLNFGPYPAAMAGFVVATDEGDTLIHKQMIIMDGKDLYYLNNTFDWNDDGTLENKGDSILSSFRISSPKASDK